MGRPGTAKGRNGRCINGDVVPFRKRLVPRAVLRAVCSWPGSAGTSLTISLGSGRRILGRERDLEKSKPSLQMAAVTAGRCDSWCSSRSSNFEANKPATEGSVRSEEEQENCHADRAESLEDSRKIRMENNRLIFDWVKSAELCWYSGRQTGKGRPVADGNQEVESWDGVCAGRLSSPPGLLLLSASCQPPPPRNVYRYTQPYTDVYIRPYTDIYVYSRTRSTEQRRIRERSGGGG